MMLCRKKLAWDSAKNYSGPGRDLPSGWARKSVTDIRDGGPEYGLIIPQMTDLTTCADTVTLSTSHTLGNADQSWFTVSRPE